jgi:signal peptidase II
MQAARGASLNPSDPAHPPGGRPLASRPRPRALALLAAVAAVGYAVDLTTKIIAVERLTDRAPLPVVGELLTLRLVRNPGAAFSTGTSYTLLLSLVAIAAVCAVLWFARRLRSTGWALALGFLLAGVLGNLTDRVFRSPGFLRGHVVDFLQLPNWPIFNVADICINVAAVLIVVQAVRGISIDGSRSGDTSSPDRSAGDPGPAP